MLGRLASTDITNAATNVQLYTPTSSKTGSVTVCFTNRNSSNAKVRLALTTSTSVTADAYLAYDVTVYPNENYERSGIVVGSGQYLYVRSDVISVNAVVFGYEE